MARQPHDGPHQWRKDGRAVHRQQNWTCRRRRCRATRKTSLGFWDLLFHSHYWVLRGDRSQCSICDRWAKGISPGRSHSR